MSYKNGRRITPKEILAVWAETREPRWRGLEQRTSRE